MQEMRARDYRLSRAERGCRDPGPERSSGEPDEQSRAEQQPLPGWRRQSWVYVELLIRAMRCSWLWLSHLQTITEREALREKRGDCRPDDVPAADVTQNDVKSGYILTLAAKTTEEQLLIRCDPSTLWCLGEILTISQWQLANCIFASMKHATYVYRFTWL